MVNYSNKFLVFDFDDSGQSGLIWACKMNFTNIAKYLIDNHSRINWQDIAGRTALHFAVLNNNYTLAKYLLLHLADPGIQSFSN